MNWTDYGYTGPVTMDEVYASGPQPSTPIKPVEEIDNGWQFTVSIDTGTYTETKQGFSKATEENLACFRLGPLFIMWGKNQ